MPEAAIVLSQERKDELLSRYSKRSLGPGLSYGTVRDFCDSADHLPFLSGIQGDLKDLQRPAALKMILGLIAPGSNVLEVGAGEPHVAHALSELGYHVTVVDPYNGSGNGPTEFEHYVRKFPRVRIIRELFTDELSTLEPNAFECIYSISVLEHVHQPAITSLFRGIKQFLKPGGFSVHLIDHVLSGRDKVFHLQQLATIFALQSELSQETASQVAVDLASISDQMAGNPDTYYLSAEGHNRWRGTKPYDAAPFQKVVSVHSIKQKAHDWTLP